MKRWLLSLVTVLVLLAAALSAAAGHDPAQQLEELLVEVGSFETCFEAGDWAKAGDCLSRLQGKYEAIHAEAHDQIPDGLHRRITVCFKSLAYFIEQGNRAKVDQMHAAMQVVLFDIMDSFDYAVHPLAKTLHKYIDDEAREALAAGEFDEVRAELHEVTELVNDNLGLLRRHGIRERQLRKFLATLGTAIKHCSAAETEPLMASLDALAGQLAGFEKQLNSTRQVVAVN